MSTPANPADLLAFVRAQLDDDERVSRAVPEAPWATRPDPVVNPHATVDVISVPRDRDHGRDEIVLSDVWRDGVPEYATRFDPARVLADVDAKRRILDEAERVEAKAREALNGENSGLALVLQGERLAMERTVRMMARPFADRPGYREAGGEP